MPPAASIDCTLVNAPVQTQGDVHLFPPNQADQRRDPEGMVPPCLCTHRQTWQPLSGWGDPLHLRSRASAGPAPREAIAQQIAAAMGPSGPNDEYLYGLVKALQEVCSWTPPNQDSDRWGSMAFQNTLDTHLSQPSDHVQIECIMVNTCHLARSKTSVAHFTSLTSALWLFEAKATPHSDRCARL